MPSSHSFSNDISCDWPVVPQALHVDADDGLERRQAVIVGQGVEHLVGLLLVAGDDDARAGVADDVLQLDPGIGRIDADRDRADHLDAEIGVKPFRRILAGDGDAVAGLEAERQQAKRDGARGLVVVAPGIAVPDAVILLAQRELVAMQCGALAQQLRNGDRGVLQRGPQRRGIGRGRRSRRTRLASADARFACVSSADITRPPVLRLPRGGRRDRLRSTAGSRRTSAGVPSAILRPKFRT